MKSSASRVVVTGMIVLAPALASVADSAVAQAPPQTPDPKSTEQVATVAVGGCLKEGPTDTWTLANASEPVASTANAPSPKELAELPKTGSGEFRLIGGGIFNLPSHRNGSVVVKGLLIKATPVSRINVTSVTMVSETCPPTP